MDPNTLKPSPPSSIYSRPSNDSLRASTSTPPQRTHPWAIPPPSKTATMLPFAPQHRIFKHASETLEALLFATLSAHHPALLAQKDFDCPEQIELNWACRHLPATLPHPIDRQALNDWIPDIRHHAVHRNRFTALAAVKTIAAAANLAHSLGSRPAGRRLGWLAGEMDAVRLAMVAAGALTDKHLPPPLQAALETRLVAALADDTDAQQREPGQLSEEVGAYTVEEKMRENPWTDPGLWGQDRGRNYSGSLSSSASPSSSPSFSSSAAAAAAAGSDGAGKYIPPAKRGGCWGWRRRS
ncbi:MAG: hypothetical protein Q9202_005007 [Teloschistes flavicans]